MADDFGEKEETFESMFAEVETYVNSIKHMEDPAGHVAWSMIVSCIPFVGVARWMYITAAMKSLPREPKSY